MTLATEWEVEQTWGSHQPVLAAVLEILKPQTAVECGCGEYSTGRLRKYVPHLVTIEHDIPWAKQLLKKFPACDSHQWVIQRIPANNSTNPADIPLANLDELQAFYANLSKTLPEYDFLFVDTYRCARVKAARNLSGNAKMMLLHDVRPSSWKFYNYDLLGDYFDAWYHYRLRPEGVVAGTHNLPWTALYSRDELPLDEMQPVVIRETKRLWGMEVYLEKISG